MTLESTHEDGRALTLLANGRPRLRYDYAGAPKPFCHPVVTGDGRELTLHSPDDHPWHRGLWFTWKFVDGVNYWEERDPIIGRQHTVAPPEVRADDGGVAWASSLEWRDARDGSEGVTLRERRRIVGRLLPDDTLQLDWQTAQTAARDLLLDRTPYTTWGGYGGLTVRLPNDLTGATIMLADGTINNRPVGERHAWAAIGGGVGAGGEWGGYAIFDAPQNPRHPGPIYGSARPGYNFLNPALLFHEPLALRAGEELSLRYRVLVLGRRWERAELDAAYRAFAAAG